MYPFFMVNITLSESFIKPIIIVNPVIEKPRRVNIIETIVVLIEISNTNVLGIANKAKNIAKAITGDKSITILLLSLFIITIH